MGPGENGALTRTHSFSYIHHESHYDAYVNYRIEHGSKNRTPQTFIYVKTRIYENSHQTCNKLY